MPKYINTNEGLYDLTDPNAPKLLGNMTDYAKQLAEQNFAGYKAGFENPASADLEKDWFIQRESGKVYQDLLKNTTFQEALDPNIGRAPAQTANASPLVLPAGAPPIQTADIWANQPATTERPATTKDYVAPTIQTAPMIAGQTKKTGTDLILQNGQRISADDPNNAQYAKQMGVMRKLGPTEFNALNQQWGQAGLTTQETQDNFLKKVGNDWYLRTDAPSAEQVIANRKAKDAQDKAGGAGGAGAGTNIDGTPAVVPGQSVDDILTAYNASLADEKAAASLAGQAALNIKAELDAMKSKMDLNNILETNQIAAVKQAFNAEKGTIESNPEIDMTFLNRKLGDMVTKMNEGLQNLDIANSVKEAENVYKYNTKLIEYNLAQGKADLAQKQTQMAADEFWKFQGLRLDLLQRQDTIDARTADDLRAAASEENNMAKLGYSFISPANVQAFTLKYGTDRIHTNSVNGKTYLKPTQEWSEPYNLGGDIVQKNNKTGEIRTAVNVAAGSGGGGSSGADNLTQYYAGQIRAGALDMTDVPDKYQKSVADEMAKPQQVDLSGTTFNGLTAKFKDGSSLTFKDQATLDKFKKDNNLSGTTPAAPTTPPKPVAPIYGKSQYSKVSIDTKFQELQTQNKSWGLGANVGLREELYNMGYPLAEIDKKLHPIASSINEFVNSIFK